VAKVKLLPQNDAGRRLDRYELIGEIAAGGMATVFLARLGGVGGFQRFVAIKRLHPHLAGEPEFVEMFLDEARLAAGIHHPNVVPILEVGTSESGYYLVMEYIEGDTLARVVARALSRQEGTVVPRSILMRVLLDALAGLAAAHDLTDARGRQVGLVHRDVSPQNILVGIDGSSRLTDFGVARATARLSSTGVGKLKGKLAYMAPEQTKNVAVDRRADLFSMGVILWEVLTGRRLFKADSEAVTLARLLVEPIPAPREIHPGVPPALDRVAVHALQRDPEQRFQTATEMSDALERAARDPEGAGQVGIGVARPRDVAEYVQRVIGQEISEQRESVRAWLATSEPSQVILGQHGKHAAEVHIPTVEVEPEPSDPEITGRIPLDLIEPPPDTARGIGPVPVAAVVPPLGRTLPGVMPAMVMPVIPATPRVPPSPTAVLSAVAARGGPDEDGDTTRVRAAVSMPPPAMVVPEALPSAPSFEPESVRLPPMRRSRAPVVVMLLAVTAAAAFFFWFRQRATAEDGASPGLGTEAASPPPAPSSAPQASGTAPTPSPASAVVATAAPSSAPVAPTAVAAADTRPPRPPKAAPAPPKAAPPPPSKPPRPPTTSAKPAAPAATQAPAAPPDELTNPYR
jgi:eukaryotic-like serine/threonine-protein kinase